MTADSLPPWAFGRHAARLAMAGFEPIPISRPWDRVLHPGKQPIMLEGWPQGCPREDWPRYSAYGVGVLTRYCPALDIDVMIPGVADDIQALADRVLGDAPVRYGQRPKRLMPFNLKGDLFAKIRLSWTLADVPSAVEILADKYQFVAFGQHPTGVDYAWERDPDLMIPRALLPPLDQGRALRFLRCLAGVMRRLGAVDLKARGWELEPRPRERARQAHKRHHDEAAPPWHAYTAKELAERIDPDHAHQANGWWRCKCPAHNGESHTSLVIKDTAEGPPGWHCFADCPDHDVAAEIAKILA